MTSDGADQGSRSSQPLDHRPAPSLRSLPLDDEVSDIPPDGSAIEIEQRDIHISVAAASFLHASSKAELETESNPQNGSMWQWHERKTQLRVPLDTQEGIVEECAVEISE